MRRGFGNYKNFLPAKRLQSNGEVTVITRVTDGEICARHYATGQPARVSWRQGMITGFEAAPKPPEGDVWLAPALVDLQINGFAGVDFQQDNLSAEELLAATRGLQAAGCCRYLLTLITDAWSVLTARLKRLRLLRQTHAELLHAIAGWHIEGPFLSAEPGFHGAHNPALMLDPTPEHIHELRGITDKDPLLLTIAPERQGALEAIALATSLGVRVSLGHTNASAEILRQAVEAGASGFTHLGNACPQKLDRHDNILWRALDCPGLTVSVIPDQIHVSPALFRLVHRALPKDSICYITDAMAAAGAPPGRYTIGGTRVEVGADQVVKEPGKSNYAGSALRPIDGVFRATQMLGCAWQDVWDGFSIRPAKFAGLNVDFDCGGAADFCLLQFSGNGVPVTVRHFVRGAAIEQQRVEMARP
jgi:N-acetylglucosamine-6-phosphate deacetylase